MSTRILQYCYVNRWLALIRGYGSRDLIIETTGHPPVWLPRFRAWVAQPSTMRDALALAESRHWRTEEVTEAELLGLAGREVAEAKGQLW